MTNVALEMLGISKSFGPVKALDSADLIVNAGSIHGVVGQNGAGKSTIIKVLAGIYRADEGTVRLNGETIDQITPAAIERYGVHFIHQDRLLVPAATVAEAIFLKREPRTGPFINYRAMNRNAAALVQKYFGVELNPKTLIRELSTAEQKIIQITRALANEARVLVLDEPTAALVRQEVHSLFTVLRRLRDDGIAVIFISHYMQEIQDLCDTVTVLRNGTDVGRLDTANNTADSSVEAIVALMTDRATSEMYPRRSAKVGETVLEVKDLGLNGHFNNVSFKVNAGEVVGLTGLLGSGAKELLQCLFGLEQPDTGNIRIDGEQRTLKSPANAVSNGVALIPEDRRAHGVAIGLSVSENVSIASLKQIASKGFVSRKKEKVIVDDLIDDLNILTPGGNTLVRNLSGGNQQKVAVAKWLSCQSLVYLLDEPTVAVDVGAKVEIYNLINKLASDGAALLLLSSDLDEITEMCDRILVMYRGEFVQTFQRGDANADRVLAAASGARAVAA